MKDLIITINANTRKASVSKTFAGITGENLQGNIIFDFVGEFIDGTGYLDFDNGQKYSVQMTKEENRYTAPIHNSLLQKIGKVKIQLRIEQTTEQTTVAIFKSRIIELPVFEALDQSEMPVDYAKLGEKTIVTNGTYNASDDGLDGYSKVGVNIQGRPVIFGRIGVSGNETSIITIADVPSEPQTLIFYSSNQSGSYYNLYIKNENRPNDYVQVMSNNYTYQTSIPEQRIYYTYENGTLTLQATTRYFRNYWNYILIL